MLQVTDFRHMNSNLRHYLHLTRTRLQTVETQTGAAMCTPPQTLIVLLPNFQHSYQRGRVSVCSPVCQLGQRRSVDVRF